MLAGCLSLKIAACAGRVAGGFSSDASVPNAEAKKRGGPFRGRFRIKVSTFD
jgi:hypothetical protein